MNLVIEKGAQACKIKHPLCIFDIPCEYLPAIMKHSDGTKHWAQSRNANEAGLPVRCIKLLYRIALDVTFPWKTSF